MLGSLDTVDGVSCVMLAFDSDTWRDLKESANATGVWEPSVRLFSCVTNNGE